MIRTLIKAGLFIMLAIAAAFAGKSRTLAAAGFERAIDRDR